MTTSKPRPLRLYLIRHGETEWSLSGQYTGRADIPLTAHGKGEAREVGPRLQSIPFAYVLTSPLQRAQQTCALAGPEPTPTIEPELAEWDNGDDEGRTHTEIIASRPDWNLFRDGSPNGETPAQISNRADRLIACLRALAGNVALFSHGHFGRVFAARWIGLSVEQAQHLLFDTASVSVLSYEHGDRNGAPAIALWNSDTHESLDQEPNQGPGGARPINLKRAVEPLLVRELIAAQVFVEKAVVTNWVNYRVVEYPTDSVIWTR
jgi:broad specificity phosphatase PhoE